MVAKQFLDTVGWVTTHQPFKNIIFKV